MRRSHRDARGGDVDYEERAPRYSVERRPDPRIAASVHAALGTSASIVNVGAGTGSYEPDDRLVVAVEPSASMRSQRAPGAARVVAAHAEALPLADDAVDAAMATVTVHQWGDLASGIREMRRVARGRVVVLTFDPDRIARFWLRDYAPEVIEIERRRFPSVAGLCALLGTPVRVVELAVPADCTDGFGEALFARPERFLDPAARAAQSAWTFLDGATVERFERRLRDDLESGAWDARHGHLRREASYEGSLRLVVAGT